MFANRDVIVTNDSSQRADRENNRERRKAGDKKCRADDVRFARPPISVKKGGGTFPIDIARAMDSGAIHGKSREVAELLIATAEKIKSFDDPIVEVNTDIRQIKSATLTEGGRIWTLPIADDRLIFHFLHVFKRDDIAIAGRGDVNIGGAERRFERVDLMISMMLTLGKLSARSTK